MQAIASVPGRAAAEMLIQWWLEAGVDGAVGEAPRDWLRRQEAATPAARAVAATGEKPTDLAAFQAWLASARGLPMDRPGAIRVAPQGIAGARAMLLSDLPDRDDAADGKPIGGDAWALTERMLAAIGIVPGDAYVASLSPFHAPGARFNGELEACGSLARDHIRLAKPERLILFGDAPARALLGEPLTRARGRVHRIEGVRAVATFHPRWLL
ncbi:MAG TPA: uracil-DNA glycosylase family protein, partial [Sphingomicrobium sp.]|nr:uracil-DNA glycosylase family protein [Sphingomicrobium sp.]